MNHQVKVAYLGPRGTFSQAAVLAHFADNCELHECSSIDEVFRAVEEDIVNYGVVPVENSTEGAVNNTQDCLIDSDVKIVGEVVVPIVQCLLANADASRSTIETIVSHEQSLAQCRHWIQDNFPSVKLSECPSNAQAAAQALNDPKVAAIAGALAAEEYDLQVLQASIQDQRHNSTRFLVLAKQDPRSSGKDKTSVLIYTENKPGALFRILEPFENLQVSLTKIETRPAKVEAWAYVFFIDFEGHIKDEVIVELFDKLNACTAEIKILGSYPAFVNGTT